jgi:hypothetical protein
MTVLFRSGRSLSVCDLPQVADAGTLICKSAVRDTARHPLRVSSLHPVSISLPKADRGDGGV